MEYKYLGITKYNELIFTNDGKTYNGACPYHDAYHNNDYLECISSGPLDSDVLKGLDNRRSKLSNKTKELVKDIENGRGYLCSTISCDECGLRVDSDATSYPDCPIKMYGCEVKCDECCTEDDKLIELNEPSDLFKAKNAVDFEFSDKLELIETLFCDSSGLGEDREPALTKNSAKRAATQLIKTYKETQLYAALTGIGQFQVYVGVFKKV